MCSGEMDEYSVRLRWGITRAWGQEGAERDAPQGLEWLNFSG